MKNHEWLIDGYRFGTVAARVKQSDSDRLDLALIVADRPAVAAGLTTTNLVCAAPVEITRRVLETGRCSAILANSGNANACTGERGERDAQELIAAVANALGTPADLVIPLSTGVIGVALPMDRMRPRIPDLVNALNPEGALDAARAIMTTDTVPKTAVIQGELSNGPVRMVGIAKGSGMIAPNMATMLAVILIDVRADRSFLQESLARACSTTFNAITVDGDTSTNDTVVALSGGSVNAAELGADPADRRKFNELLFDVCDELARKIVRDGEGATKVVEIIVTGAPDKASASRVGRTVAESLLVKTAFNGEDPNWGRIIAAAGRSGAAFDPDRAVLSVGEVVVFQKGAPAVGDWESAAHEIMKRPEFAVSLDMGAGPARARTLTTDLSAEYVRINADYRS